jgi:hypothetical protein
VIVQQIKEARKNSLSVDKERKQEREDNAEDNGRKKEEPCGG